MARSVRQAKYLSVGSSGDGLYGVDMKQAAKGVYVIEINNNPNLDQGVEDQVLKERLYQIVMGEFVRRLDLRHGSSQQAEKAL